MSLSQLRLVSLAPSNTEIIEALGLMDNVVGVDDWSDWPPQVARLPRVGPDLNVDLDRVESLKPDLVLASLSVPGMERNVEGLKARAIPHMVLNPQSLTDIWADLRSVADRLGLEQRADQAISRFCERIAQVQRDAGSSPAFRLYWEWWPKPIFTPGGRNWLTELSAIVGCQNIFAEIDQANVRVDDPLEVVRRSPDLILLAWTGARRPDTAHVYGRKGWEELEAVRRRRVFALAEGLFNRPSPRLVDGLERLAQIIKEAAAQ